MSSLFHQSCSVIFRNIRTLLKSNFVLGYNIKLLTIVAILFATTVLAIEPTIEGKKNLGHGFQFVTIAKNSHSTFESIGHFEYLYYKDKVISQCSEGSVRADGKIAVYQDGPSGNMFVYRTLTNTSIQLTKKFLGLARGFHWKSPNEVEVELYDHKPLVLLIPKKTKQGAVANP